MSNTVIELRQKDASIVYSDGDFTYNLAKPITLEPGDSINIKSCFIDTKQDNTDNIEIAEDTEMSLTIGYWFNNINSTIAKLMLKSDDNEYGTVDNSKYIFQKYVTGSGANVAKVTAFNLDRRRVGEKWGGFYFQFKYKSVTAGGNEETFKYLIEEKNGGQRSTEVGFFEYVVLTAGNVADIYDFKAIDRGSGEEISFDSVNVHTPTVDNFFYTIGPETDAIASELTHEVKAILPAGSYSPDEIAQTITKAFSNKLDDILCTIRDLMNFIGSDGTDDKPRLAAVHAYKRSDNDKVDAYKWATGGANYDKIYIGSSQFALEYDETGRFQFKAIHFPVYDTGGNIIIDYNKYSAWSGIYFKDMSPPSLWYDLLGFSQSENTVSMTSIDGNVTQGGVPGTFVVPESFNSGVHYTEQYRGMDSAVNKESENYFIKPDTDLPSTSSQTNPITATQQYEGQALNGYFLVEIQGLRKVNDFVNNVSNRADIKAIVNRYYSVRSYTSAGTECDIPFVNYSEFPFTFSSLRVRILSPNGELADDIADDNTVFMSINRNLQALEQTSKSK
ncbi:TPA_asm: hypothetical protein [Monosiga MELD virus 2]|nr:TPA_asm: hypothetical protein [Monosiga MELD virus 2]